MRNGHATGDTLMNSGDERRSGLGARLEVTATILLIVVGLFVVREVLSEIDRQYLRTGKVQALSPRDLPVCKAAEGGASIIPSLAASCSECALVARSSLSVVCRRRSASVGTAQILRSLQGGRCPWTVSRAV